MLATSRRLAACSSRGLLAVTLALLCGGFQLAVAFRVDFLLTPRQHILRRDVADGTVQADVVAFTIAHSITLAAATLGFVHVEVAPVEATIALSILFLAAELVRAQRGESGIAHRAPWIVAFAFGLLHGLGFASTLGRMGLPHSDIPLALLLFNVGVELGQLGFVIVFIGFVRSLATLEIRWPDWTRAIPAYAIGSFAALTFLQRLDAIFW